MTENNLPTKYRILLIIHSLGGGGAERVTVNLADYWQAAGHEIAIATLVGDALQRYNLSASVRHLPLGVARPSSGFFSGLLNNFNRIRRIRRLLRDEQPDIAIGMMSTSATLLALARTKDVIAIGSEHSYPGLDGSNALWTFLRRNFYGRLNAVTALTRKGADWLQEHTTAHQVAVIPNAIHLPLPRQEPFLNLMNIVDPARPLLLAVGRLVAVKAFDKLIHAFADLAQEHSTWKLVILGEGPLRSELEAQIDALGLLDRVHLPGWAGNLTDWYDKAEILAVTSEYEGFSNVLIEAMAHGCAVISYDVDAGPRDIITHGKDGLLIADGDHEEFVRTLGNLMKDDALRGEMGEAARQVGQRFSPSVIDQKWQSLFRSIRSRQ